MRPSLRAVLAGTLATASLGFAPYAFADNIQDDIVEADDQVITLVPGSGIGVSANIRAVGNNADGTTTDPGCNWDSGEAPLVLDVVTPSGVTASPAQISITTCGVAGAVPVTFTAAAGAEEGNATVSVVSRPAGGGGYTNQVSITIVFPVTNTAPTGVADSYTTAEDTQKVVVAPGVLGNDTDAQGDALTAEKVTDPAHGSVALAASGSFTFTPDADYSGADSFTYKAKDAAGLYSAATTVSLTVTPVNDVPVALDDSASTDEEVAVDISVLGNDSDVDSSSLTVTGAGDGAHGTTAYDANSVVYTPAPDFFGSDSFTYTVGDGDGGTDQATVTVTVSNVNDAPVAADDSASTDEDTPLTVAVPGVLANDGDVDGDGLTASVVDGPGHASAFSLDADGSYSYSPVANWFGTDSFTYRASDGGATSGVATVTITVAPVNDAPVADDETLTLAEDAQGTVAVLVGDTDVEGDTLAVTGKTDGANGTVAINADGTLTYTPAADFSGTDSFTYTVCDDHATTPASEAGCDTATVAVTVTAVNDAPVVTAGDPASTDEGSPVSISATFTDVDQAEGETYTASIAWGDGSTSAGTVTGNTVTGTHTYVDDEAGAADDVFQAVVTVTDAGTTNGAADPLSDTATVPVTVSNVAPTVAAPSVSVNPFTGVLTLATTFSDPAVGNDTYSGSFDVAGTTVDGATVAGSVSGTTMSATTVLAPGCYTVSATATVSDEDDGTGVSGTGQSGTAVDVYSVSFQAPIRDDARNVARYGNVVPVKVVVVSSCTGLPVTSTPLSIQVVKGNVTDDVTVDDSNAAVTESVSNADSGTQMRVSDGKYIYNLSTKGLATGVDYTIRIRAGSSSTTSPIILRALLSTKK